MEHKNTNLFSAGELIDRIFILKLKLKNIKKDKAAKKKINNELRIFLKEQERMDIPDSKRLKKLKHKLWRVLKLGWTLEVAIRKTACYKQNKTKFTKKDRRAYIEISLRVHKNNDLRSKIKNKINSLLESSQEEIKIY